MLKKILFVFLIIFFILDYSSLNNNLDLIVISSNYRSYFHVYV